MQNTVIGAAWWTVFISHRSHVHISIFMSDRDTKIQLSSMVILIWIIILDITTQLAEANKCAVKRISKPYMDYWKSGWTRKFRFNVVRKCAREQKQTLGRRYGWALWQEIVSDIEEPPRNFLGGSSITRIVEFKRKRW